MWLVGLEILAALSWNELAFQGVRRRKSHTAPWNVLVPFLVTMLITPPEVFPFCGSYVLVCTLNSVTASMGGLLPARMTFWLYRLLGAPSRVNSFFWFNPPAIDTFSIAF